MARNDLDIKKGFYSHFNLLLRTEKDMMYFFYEIFIIGTAYVVGGYFRDFINKKKSRDIDVIVEIDSSKLIDLLKETNCIYELNKHGGIKIKFKSIKLDIWSIQDNWAFRNELVKLNDDDKLNSIAKGCFYNYDSLVINLHNFSYNTRYYNEFVSTNKLDIIQLNSIYKNLNPTTEANILRAFYIKLKHGSTFTINTYNYLLKKVGSLNDSYNCNPLDRLLEVKKLYPKYNVLTKEKLIHLLMDLKQKDNPNDQIILDI